MPREEDRFILGVDRNGALTLEGQPIARKDLAGKLARQAAQVRLNIRAIGGPVNANHELPAVIVIHANAETPCSTIFPLMDDCRRSGFVQFALKSPQPQPGKDDLAEIGPSPAVRNKDNDVPEGLRTIPIRLGADDRGLIGQAEVGEAPAFRVRLPASRTDVDPQRPRACIRPGTASPPIPD